MFRKPRGMLVSMRKKGHREMFVAPRNRNDQEGMGPKSCDHLKMVGKIIVCLMLTIPTCCKFSIRCEMFSYIV